MLPFRTASFPLPVSASLTFDAIFSYRPHREHPFAVQPQGPGEKSALPLNASNSVPVPASHTCTLPTAAAVSTFLPSGANAAPNTGVPGFRARICFPVSASHNLAVPSWDAVSTFLPSDEKAAEFTVSV